MKIEKFNEMYGRYLDVSHIPRKMLDVKYGPYERNVLDIYYPCAEEVKGAIVFFHGGGFIKGDKRRYQLAPALQGTYHGYIVVSVNYRLAQTAPLPAAVYDAKCAIRFLKANSTELGIDPGRIVVWGESAGALLACLIGVQRSGEMEDLAMGWSEQDATVQAVIDWYAPTDMTKAEDIPIQKLGIASLEWNTVNEFCFRKKGAELETAITSFNPIRHIHDKVPPFFIQHGLNDSIVDFRCSTELYKALSPYLARNDLKLTLIKGAEHGVADFSNEENLDAVFDFIKTHI